LVFDYDSLPRDFKRKYLPADLKFGWDALSEVFKDLSSRPILDASELKKWLQDEDEFNAYIYEQRTIRYINSTRQTDNPESTKAYEQYVEELEPKIKIASFELLKKYSASHYRSQLPRDSHGLEDRRREAAIRVFRVENVELEKKDSTLAQKYQRTRGAMMVNFRGQEWTLQQMAKFLEETDRSVREEAWRLAEARALQDRDTLEEIYDRMVKLRDQVAHNAGYDNYEDYIFVRKARFDYTRKTASSSTRRWRSKSYP
jgi:oligoendopeptidase F